MCVSILQLVQEMCEEDKQVNIKLQHLSVCMCVFLMCVCIQLQLGQKTHEEDKQYKISKVKGRGQEIWLGGLESLEHFPF